MSGFHVLASFLLAAAAPVNVGQTVSAEAASLQFSLDRPGPVEMQYTVTLEETGTGSYLPHVPDPAGSQPATVEGEPKPIHVDPALVHKLFAAVPMVQGGHCETHNKNIAKTGVKVLHYRGNGRDASCTYNFSDDDRVNNTTAAFQAIAETLQYGDRLRSKLRFDRLGLDSELEGLQSAVNEQRALELGNIAPVLKSIVADERVMDRARRRAERLLQSTALPVQASAADGSSPR